MEMTVERASVGRPNIGTRLAGSALLVSVPLWLEALRWWASSQHGYLDVDAIGPSPFVWLLLIAVGGLALVVGALPRARTVGTVAVVLGFLLLAGALAAVNIVAAAGNGISSAGWLIAGFSIGQVAVFVAGVAGGWMHRRR